MEAYISYTTLIYFQYNSGIQTEKMSNQFNVTLLSNDSIKKYPNNVLSNFTNYIDCPLNLYGSWEVGISEIFYNAFTPSYSYIKSEKTEEMIEEGYIDTATLSEVQLENDVMQDQKFFDMLYIHVDIICPRIVGDQMVRCLKVMPAIGRQQEYIKFGRIEYYPVELFHIRSISVLILDAESNLIDFNKSLLPTMLTLHFRKIHI